MEYDVDKIVEISLAKMKGKTVTSRRRDGNSLRRNLLVSHLLNSAVFNSSKNPELQYRNHVEIDIDIDVDIMDQAVGKNDGKSCSKCGRDGFEVEFTDTGSTICELCVENPAKEIPTSEQTIELSVEITPKDIEETEKAPKPSSPKLQNKRRCDVEETHYSHEVPCKRQRTELELLENSRESVKTAFPETKDISALVSVFHNGFSGLSTLCESASATGFGIFNYDYVDRVEQCSSYQRTIVAF